MRRFVLVLAGLGCAGFLAVQGLVVPSHAQAQVRRRSRPGFAPRRVVRQCRRCQPWAITVSGEGGWCSHRRKLGTNNYTYGIAQSPQHGEILQQPNGPETIISYKPAAKYVGTDSFRLRAPRNIEMQYLVTVIP